MAQECTWLTVPELVDLIDQPVGRIRRLIEEHRLPASRRDGVLRVPALAIRDGAPLPDLRGTLLVLLDLGLTEDEAVDWLLADDDSLGMAPLVALNRGQKSSVRRAAQLIG